MKAEQDSIKISSTETTVPAIKKSKSFLRNRGFSLVEVMIVLGIMTVLITMGLSRVKRRENNVKQVTRHFLALVKETRNRARLTSNTYRIVFQLDEKNPSYWVEQGNGRKMRESVDEKKKREEAEKDSKDKDKKPPPQFTRDDRITKKPINLPAGLFFGGIDVQGSDALTTSGTEFIYFSPEGFVEPSVIQITDKKNLNWSLAISPLTGQIDIITETKTLKDLQR